MITIIISIVKMFCECGKKTNKKSKLLKNGDLILVAISMTKIFG
jgi:hypothetical protein